MIQLLLGVLVVVCGIQWLRCRRVLKAVVAQYQGVEQRLVHVAPDVLDPPRDPSDALACWTTTAGAVEKLLDNLESSMLKLKVKSTLEENRMLEADKLHWQAEVRTLEAECKTLRMKVEDSEDLAIATDTVARERAALEEELRKCIEDNGRMADRLITLTGQKRLLKQAVQACRHEAKGRDDAEKKKVAARDQEVAQLRQQVDEWKARAAEHAARVKAIDAEAGDAVSLLQDDLALLQEENATLAAHVDKLESCATAAAERLVSEGMLSQARASHEMEENARRAEEDAAPRHEELQRCKQQLERLQSERSALVAAVAAAQVDCAAARADADDARNELAEISRAGEHPADGSLQDEMELAKLKMDLEAMKEERDFFFKENKKIRAAAAATGS